MPPETEPQPSFDIQTIRQEFPMLQRRVNGKPLVYLENAGSSLVLQLQLCGGNLQVLEYKAPSLPAH
jgi:selenocysteine lyase/cysteine desulfurase